MPGPRPSRPRLAMAGLPPILAVLALPLAPARPLHADGGTLRVANVPMGAYRVSVFTDPTPIPPDSIDVSVLATFERGRGVASGLEILVVARRVDGTGAAVRYPATREQATDPRYYSAKFALGSVGEWEVVVSVKGPEGQGEAAFQITAQEPGLFSNPYLILGAALIPLLLAGWWLRFSSPSTRPGGG